MTRATCLLGALVAAVVYFGGSSAAYAADCYDIQNASSANVTLQFLYQGLVPQNCELRRELYPGTSHRYCESYDSHTIVMIDSGTWSPKAPVFGVDKPGAYKIVDKPKPKKPKGLTANQARRKARLARLGEGRYELLGYHEITGCGDGFHFGSCEEPATEVKVRCLANDRVRQLVCTRDGTRCNLNVHEFFNGLTRKSLPNHCPRPA